MKSVLTRKVTVEGRPDVRPLLVLLRAPSEEEIVRVLEGVFAHRRDPWPLPRDRTSELARVLRCDDNAVKGLLESVRAVLWQLVEAPSRPAEGASLPEDIASLFDDDFHQDLREVLVALLAAMTPRWRVELDAPPPKERGKDPTGGRPSGGSSAAKWRPLEADSPRAAVSREGAPSDATAKAKAAGKAVKKAPSEVSAKAQPAKARGVSESKSDVRRSSGGSGGNDSGAPSPEPQPSPHAPVPVAPPTCGTSAEGDAGQIGSPLPLADVTDNDDRGGAAAADAEEAAPAEDDGFDWDDDDFAEPVMPDADEDSDG